jgi:ribose transport system substrate-binding protein
MRRTHARRAAIGLITAGAFTVAGSGGFVAGSSGTTEPPEATEAEGTEPVGTGAGGGGTIAFSYGNESAGIYPIVAEPARIQAEARGYEFIEGSANGDCDQQVRDVENFVVQEVDAIVVLPLCGVEPLTPVLEEADAAGIVVVGYSTEVPSGDGAIVYQNVDGAEALAAEAIRWYEEDFTGDQENFSWGLFTYDQCGTACTDRTDPIRAAIVEATGVEPLEAESVDETSGLEATETFLQQEPELAMVIGINDAGALGAYQAMQGAIANGRDPESIFVAGMDGQIEALELLAEGGGENGVYRASGALILDDLGRAVADLPADILEGEDVEVLELPYEIITPADAERAQEIVDTYNQFTSA